jgi:hypothetical protein
MSSCGVIREEIDEFLFDDDIAFMIKNCYGDYDWNQADFEDNCCSGGKINKKDLKNGEGLCRPTVMGGYCYNDNISDGNERIYYKYKDSKDNDKIREPYMVRFNDVKREKTYNPGNNFILSEGIEDTKKLQQEFYNELMINRILSTEPSNIRRNIEREILKEEEIADEDIKKIITEIKKEEEIEEEYAPIILILIIILILLFGGFLIFYVFKNNKNKKMSNDSVKGRLKLKSKLKKNGKKK